MTGIQTESCYSNERMLVTLPRPDTKQPIPRITSMEDLEAMGSPTKVVATAKLAGYMLSDDNALIPRPVNGELIIPDYVPNPSATRKVLIYNEFTIFMPFLIDASLFCLTPNRSLTKSPLGAALLRRRSRGYSWFYDLQGEDGGCTEVPARSAMPLPRVLKSRNHRA